MIPLTITIDDEHSLWLTRDTQKAITKQVYLTMGLRYRNKWIKRHFTRNARNIYGYRERSTKWKQRKERMAQRGSKVKKGGRVDLVFTGLAERLFSRDHAVRAYPTRATVIMHGPTYVTMKPRAGNVNALGPEVLKTVAEEHRDIAKHGEEELEKLLKKAPRRKRKFKGRRGL